MSTKRRNSRGTILTALWIVTAAAAMIVMVIYFDRMTKLFADSDTQSNIRTEAATGNRGTDEAVTPATESSPKKKTDDEAARGNLREQYAEVLQDEEPDPEALNDDEVLPEEQQDALPEVKEDTEPVVEGIDPSKPIVALTFDDGPGIYTERIVETLSRYGAKATFFMVGYNIDYYPEIVKLVYDAGCEIGNHTTNHIELTKGTSDQVTSAVFDNEDKLSAILGTDHFIVRPPYGSYNSDTETLVDRPMICWSVDSLDWKTKDPDKIVPQVKQDVKDGYIILMHDIYGTTADAVDILVPWLVDQGYQITTVSEMFKARGEELLDGHVYRYTSPAAN